MAISSFEKLLTQNSVCVDLSTDKITAGTVDWEVAREQANAYRTYVEGLPIDPKQKIASYILTEEDIKSLLSQNQGKIRGVRIYLGKEQVNNGWVTKLYIVGCELNPSNNQYDDFDLSEDLPQNHDSPILSEVRPCPDNCGKRNFMNNP